MYRAIWLILIGTLAMTYESIPEQMSGATFLEQCDKTADTVTDIDSDAVYAVFIVRHILFLNTNEYADSVTS